MRPPVTGLGHRHLESLLGVQLVILDLRVRPQADGEVVVHGLVIEEILPDDVAAVAQAQHEFAEPIVGIRLHDVPRDGAPADFDHRLGAEFRFFSQPRPYATAKYHHFHVINSVSRADKPGL